MNIQRFLLCAATLLLSVTPASGLPQFLAAYKADPYQIQNGAGCNLCHMSPQGGDPRNVFGRAFETAGERITPLLRAQFPDKFGYPVSRTAALTVYFSDPDHKVVIVEAAGTMSVVDAEKSTTDGTPGVETARNAAAGAAPAAAPQKTAPATDSFAREGAFFGQSVGDLPNGKPQKKGGVDFWIGHRFPEDAFHGSRPDLFGFDSVATVAFGVRVGLTDRFSVSAARSNSFRTIEIGSSFQVMRQGGSSPLTLQVRGTVEGRDNFHISRDLEWTGYAPSIQFVAVRTFAGRLSLLAAPTFAFNTRNENFPASLEFGADSNNTTALGLGGGYRILSTTSLVAEWVPRLGGFRGERTDRPEISFGVQKATYRHAFELLFSTARPMTTSRYPVGGTDVFGIGFNIYRKIR